jgi:hypothetical protein
MAGGEPWLEALDAIDPQDIVVSVGEDNKHDHPHQEMIDIYNSAAGSDHVRQTCLDGTLVMTVTSEGTYELQPDPSYAERFGWDPSDQQKTPHLRGSLIGAPRFELGTSPTRTVRATRLRHAPTPRQYPTRARALSSRADACRDI